MTQPDGWPAVHSMSAFCAAGAPTEFVSLAYRSDLARSQWVYQDLGKLYHLEAPRYRSVGTKDGKRHFLESVTVAIENENTNDKCLLSRPIPATFPKTPPLTLP